MKHLAVLFAGLALAVTFAQDTPSREQRIENWLRNQDADNDGRISADEATGQMQANFQRNDSNNDSFLDTQELGALAERLGQGQAARRTPQLITDGQMSQRVAEGVLLELNIPYREGDELWTLDLAMPEVESDRPRPAIVLVHGGGWVRGDKRNPNFVELMLDYAATGYVAINVNYRLDPSKLPCVQDVKCAVRWLRAHAAKYNVDPGRIGAYGNSAGAHLVAMLGLSHGEPRLDSGPWLEHSSAVQAVAASATPTRPNVRGGTEADRTLISPMTYVSTDAPPFLLFHEASDSVVNVSNSDDLVSALRNAGVTDVIYRRYTDGSGHGVFRANLEETAPEMRRFFARALGTE